MHDWVAGVPSVDKEKPHGAAILGISELGTFAASRWVIGGNMEAETGFKAKNIFPLADKDLYLELRGSYADFTFPNTASNFSSYLDVPAQVPVVAYMLDQNKQKNFIDWGDAQARGCADFSVRVVVLPLTTKTILLQLGVAPFGMAHMKQLYSEVMDRPYFPNTMVRCTKTRTRLPTSMGGGTSMLVKEAPLLMEDTEGYGLGSMPFFVGTNFDPLVTAFEMPSFESIQEALFNHMRAGALPMAKSAAHMAAALAVAIKADKDPANFMGPVSSPWPAFTTTNPGDGNGNFNQGRYP